MKFVSSCIILSSAILSIAEASCSSEKTIDLKTSATQIKLMGFAAKSVERITGQGNKIVLKGYDYEPEVDVGSDMITISAGSPCKDDGDVGGDVPDDGGGAAFSAAAGLGVTSLFSKNAIALGLATLAFSAPYASAAAHGCANEIIIEIYTDAAPVAPSTDLEAYVEEEFKIGECPTESMWWKHHPSVFGGYEGCVAEKYLSPCAFDVRDSNTTITYSEGSCVDTGKSMEDRTFWILWGDPMDKEELVKRTGATPTVVFPLTRGPYPSYPHGGPDADETGDYNQDDAKSAKAVAKDWLVYSGAIAEGAKDDWLVSMTEGAENGIQMLWAAKALEIARTTCNREIYALMEAPAYGYSTSEISLWVNNHASSFYEGDECLCATDGTCKDPIVSVNNVGFFPPNIPSRLGGDNITYAADSTSPSSPWFESMVFPENPSGRIKTPQIPNANRRVCDGVYVWPMYFYYNDFEIPLEDVPDCFGWSYAITKGYSASVRSGFITYKKDAPEASLAALGDIASGFNSLGYGSYSEWAWWGQMQLQEYFMKKPLDDPTSWVGAYSSIMKEKWDLVTEAFEDCPMITLTNPGRGAYSFFIMNDGYRGLSSTSTHISSFFQDVLGVVATTYSWGFRGADPSEYYGDGVGTRDFVRMQLYRDVNVYKEVARRAKKVCSDPSINVGLDLVSPDDYVLIQTAGTRRRLHEVESREERHRMLKEEVPHLKHRQLNRVLDNMEMRVKIDEKASTCAPEYNMNCLFDTIGRRNEDY